MYILGVYIWCLLFAVSWITSTVLCHDNAWMLKMLDNVVSRSHRNIKLFGDVLVVFYWPWLLPSFEPPQTTCSSTFCMIHTVTQNQLHLLLTYTWMSHYKMADTCDTSYNYFLELLSSVSIVLASLKSHRFIQTSLDFTAFCSTANWNHFPTIKRTYVALFE